MVVFFVQLHFTTRVRYGFLSVQLNYTIRLLFYIYFYYIKEIGNERGNQDSAHRSNTAVLANAELAMLVIPES